MLPWWLWFTMNELSEEQNLWIILRWSTNKINYMRNSIMIEIYDFRNNSKKKTSYNENQLHVMQRCRSELGVQKMLPQDLFRAKFVQEINLRIGIWNLKLFRIQLWTKKKKQPTRKIIWSKKDVNETMHLYICVIFENIWSDTH